MRLLMLLLVPVSLGSAAFAADILVIDDFEYPDATAAREAWRPAEDSEPVEVMPRETDVGAAALGLPCTFARQRQNNRSAYDRAVDLDLVRFGSIVFDFYADDPAPIRGGTIYFRSGDGWYGAGFGIERGWNRISLGKGAFRPEGTPAGWDQVDTIRVAIWKARDMDTFCAVDNLHARSESIAVVSGRIDGAEERTARDTAERVGNLLTEAGVPHGILSSTDVIAGALEGKTIAIFAYSPGMGDEEAEQVREFIADGGKVIMFYTIRHDIAPLLGLAQQRYMGRERNDQFRDVAFDTEAVTGLPESMYQGSWNITAAQPGEHNARAIGWWQDAEGDRGEPAVILSDNGAFMGHILTGEDAGRQAFLLALVGHFEPAAWQDAANYALTGAVRVGPFTALPELQAFLAERGPRTPFADRIAAHLEEARVARERLQELLAAERYQDVIAQAGVVRAALSDAYVLAHRARDGEFRAVWNHSGTGDLDSWDDAMRALSEGGFNAVVPNMWWGGVAHYASDLLPRSQTFEERGDQIAQAVEAGKRYGVEVHPWKVNYNLGRAPQWFVQQLREQGRLQARYTGEEAAWLCPSHPDNQRLEIDTMVEVARNYDVDGVHFDYIRYPGEDSCYCDGCRERFEAHIGRAVEDWPGDCHRGELRQQYRDWRCEQITTVVRGTAEEVRAIKPHVKISGAVFSNYPATKNSIGQDWVMWCREGWLDFVCPMNYTTSDSSFTSMTAAQVGYVQGVVPLYTGIGHWRISDEQAIGQVEISRSLGADGFILFNMGASLAETALPKFGRAITSEPAVLPHNAPVVSFSSPADDDEPIVQVDGDSLRVDLALASLGAHRQAATGAVGFVEVQDMEGNALQRLGDLPAVETSAQFTIARRAGAFRLAAVGVLTFEDGTPQSFIRRSRPYQFAAAG